MKISNYLVGFLFINILFSCEDLLTEKPLSYFNAESFFISEMNAENALMGIYDVLAKIQHYGQWEMPIPTSDGQYSVRGTNSDNTRRDISHYTLTPSNRWVEALWMWKYTGIERANYFLDNLRSMDAYQDGNEKLNSIEGEACFLRAMLYFDLVRYWGDVPFKLTYSKSSDSGILPRTDRMEIYEQIIDDLTIAKNQLGIPDSPERVSQSAARALLMRVYLHKAGYSLKMNGELTRPDETIRQECFQGVLSEFQHIESLQFHELNPNYKQLWKNYSQGILEPKESIFEISFYTPDGSNEDAGVWGTYIGPKTDTRSSYGRANAFFVINAQWFDYYDSTDVRRDVNICRYEVDENDERVEITNLNRWYPGKWRREWMGPGAKNPNNTDVNYVFIRYADVILMAAEAYNEIGDQARAVELINRIRTRANIPLLEIDLSNYDILYAQGDMALHEFIQDGDPKGKISRALYWERGFELCYEGVRKFDLIRWGILGQVLKSIPSSTHYKAVDNFVIGKHELLPIPLREMDLNPELKGINNPGY